MLIFQLAIILLASKIAGDVSVKLGQPSVLGKLLIGILLGPSVLGLVTDTDILSELSQIGVILLMFIAGLETDADEFKRTGKASTFVGIAGIIVPLSLGYLAGTVVGLSTLESNHWGLIIGLSILAIATKLVGSAIGAKLAGFDWNSSLGIGSAMISRGEVALIIAAIGLESGLLSRDMFAVIVVVVLVTTIITPPLMKLFFKARNENVLEHL